MKSILEIHYDGSKHFPLCALRTVASDWRSAEGIKTMQQASKALFYGLGATLHPLKLACLRTITGG